MGTCLVTKLKESVDAEDFPTINELRYSTVTGKKAVCTDTLEDTIINDINLIGETTQYQPTGKNLWGGFNTYTNTNAGVTWTTNWDGTIIANGTSTANTNSCNTVANAITQGLYVTLPAGTYTVSGGKDKVAILQVYKNDNDNLLVTVTASAPKTFTLDTEANIVIRGYLREHYTVDNYTFKIQLEQGSTATDYEPYSAGIEGPDPLAPVNVQTVTGKIKTKLVNNNYLPIPINGSYTDNGITVTNNNGVYTVTGTATGAVGLNFVFSIPAIKIKPGQYLHFHNNVVVPGSLALVLGYSNFGVLTLPIGSIDKIYPVSQEYWIDSIGIYANTEAIGETFNFTMSLSLEDTNEATDFVPNQLQTVELNLGTMELCKIGNYQDVLFKNSKENYYYNANLTENKWYKFSNIGKMIFTGNNNENWEWNDCTNGRYRYFLNQDIGLKDLESTTSNIPLIYSDRFKSLTPIQTYGGNAGISTHPSSQTRPYGRIALCYMSNDTSTISLFKSWLNTNRPVMYYLLETPTYTEITDSTLLAQLENLEYVYSYKDLTIVYTDVNTEPTLQVTYPKYF